MGFAETLKDWTKHALNQRAACKDEASVKNALVVPFIHNVLEFNVFNLKEVLPEHLCVFGLGKTDRVDYATFLDEKLVMIIECKGGADVTLNEKHFAQLKQYYAACETKNLIGILTNGIEWRFFFDLINSCQMHPDPFLLFHADNFGKKEDVDLLEMLTKPKFNKAAISRRIIEIQRIKRVKDELEKWLNSLPDDFVTLMAKRFEKGKIGPKVKRRYRGYLKAAVRGYLTDQIEKYLPTTGQTKVFYQEKTVETPTDSVAKESASVSGQLHVESVISTPGFVEKPANGGPTEDIKPAIESGDGSAVQPDEERRKIKASDLAADIKSGMSFQAVMGKYAISSTKLSEFLHHLVYKGLLRNEDLPEQTL
ncbi:MAG: type I restriction enzyme HsdR N-terminal domain-containing protein [Pseudomonadota bacterium]